MRPRGLSAPQRAAALAVALLAVAALTTPAMAQNGYSFLDAAQSPIDYRVASAAPRIACAELRGRAPAGVTILSAAPIAATDAAPAFCRVHGVVAPEVQFEVALPHAWNRRLYMRGNGGFAGEALDAAPRLAVRNAALRHGFLAVQTNTGHDAAAEPLATFGGDLAKRVDYAFRAVHVTVQAAKHLAQAYYDRPTAFAYWDGCSTGGRQGLISAQRFPGDFDGIIAGAPVLNFTGSMLAGLWNARALAAAPVSLDKLRVVAAAAYRRCDARDGLEDGLIDDPRACDFDPARDVPVCAAGEDGADCLTPAQAAALKSIYAGPSAGGRSLFFGQPIGAEKIGTPAAGAAEPASGWDTWIVDPRGKSRQLTFAESFTRHMAFGTVDPAYDWKAFDFEKDPARMGAIGALLDATDPDLSEFRARGGKLLMYFGWADTALTPLMAIDYHDRVQARGGGAPGDFFRLFLVPGMFHCRGGVGVDRFDALTPLINWVENGKAPERIQAARVEQGRPVRTRPLCPYPQVARYGGRGSVDEAQSFACAGP